MRRAGVLALLTVVLALPAPARGNGNNAHIWISREAVRQLPDGSLRRLLERPALSDWLLSGTIFPDGGYVIGDDYGEIAHWEPFARVYSAFIARSYPGSLERGEAAEQIAFLMGVISHGIADQTHDAMFMRAGRVEDAAGWSDDTFTGFDTCNDVFLVEATQRFETVTTPRLPLDVATLFRDELAHPVSQSTIELAESLLASDVIGWPQKVARGEDVPAREACHTRYPWSQRRLMQLAEPGSPPCEARIASAYMLALWDRVHGVSAQQNFVIATVPSDGAAGHPTDPAREQAQVVVVFGHGMAAAAFAGADAVVVRDDTGKRYDVDVRPWRDPSNVLRIVPREPWAAERDFTVTLAAGLTAIDGLTLQDPLTFRFSTRPMTAAVAECADPTPHVGEPPLRPVADAGGDGGCAVAPGRAQPAAAASGALLLGALGALLLGALLLGAPGRTRRPRTTR